MIKTFLIIFFSCASVNLFAQPPDSLFKPSPVKTISAAQYYALIKGEDLYGMSLAADLNGYPSARKALKYKKELDLSPSQTAALIKLNTELQRKKVEMGGFIVTNETKLDNLFRTKKISDGDLIFYTNRYGLYMGELRNAILLAALNATKLLTPLQISKLKAYKNEN